jgi:SAM-dependent methyltransferase
MNHKCRFCGNKLKYTFSDLGMSPLANSYLKAEQLHGMEPFYSLHVLICEKCFLVQLPVVQTSEHIFSDYAYFSSYSESWLKHAKEYTSSMVERFGFDSTSQVIEIASNDGYLLQYFKEKGIPVLGIEPAENVAAIAKEIGIPTRVEFFGLQLAKRLSDEGTKPDLLIGNNVLAHVPDLNDFVGGMKTILKPSGIVTMEFPHLMRLMEENQFDTIYHEHFSYFSFTAAKAVFEAHGLEIFDVEELTTHGGSLRIFAKHVEDDSKSISHRVKDLLRREDGSGFRQLDHYLSFHDKVKETKRNILSFLIEAKRQGKAIVGYGAPAKGNTLLNYCGLQSDFIDYTVDRSPHKQGQFLPGVHIPIYHPDKIQETMPDYVVILPWNLKDEIIEQMAHVRVWGGQFVVLIPEVRIFP